MGDIIALIAAFVMFSLSEKCTLPTYPLYTNMFLFYLFMTFNFINFGFFFGGSEFSFHPKFGVMGLFTRDNFVSIFYVSIILGLSLMILLTLVN